MATEAVGTVTDFLTALPTEGIQFGGATPIIMMWLKIIIFFGVTVFGIVAYNKFYMRYKVKIRIIKEIGGKGIEIKTDRAREVTDAQGKRKLELMKKKRGIKRYTMPIPPPKYLIKEKRFDYYDLYEDVNGELHPMEYLNPTEEETKYLAPVPQERTAWGRYERLQTEEMYKQQQAWKELLPAAIMVVAFLVSFLILFFMFKEVGIGMTQLAGSFREVAQACLS